MNEIYPRWAAADPDPTSTHGKDATRAKAMELAGWDYPKHLAGRAYAVVVHGDAAGTEELRRSLCDWVEWMRLTRAAPSATLDRYIGYFEPYATSHDALDRDEALKAEVRNAAASLVERIKQIRSGEFARADEGLEQPRKKRADHRAAATQM